MLLLFFTNAFLIIYIYIYCSNATYKLTYICNRLDVVIYFCLFPIFPSINFFWQYHMHSILIISPKFSKRMVQSFHLHSTRHSIYSVVYEGYLKRPTYTQLLRAFRIFIIYSFISVRIWTCYNSVFLLTFVFLWLKEN